MAKISILIASLLLCTLIQGQVPMSPCPQYFTYMTDPTTNEIKGQIEIPSPPKNVQLHLRVTIKTDVELPTRYDGRLELARTKEESVRAVEQGRSLLYHLHFPLRQPIPTLTEILFNGEQYCSGPPPSGNFMTTIMLERTLYPPNVLPLSNSQSNVRPSASMHRITTQPPKKPIRSSSVSLSQGIGNNVFLRPTTTSSRPAPQPAPQPVSQNDYTNNNNNNDQCGISQQNYGIVNLLVANGEKTLPGQWPWLVALFLVRPKHEFRCGGSILTNKHIITAGHCLKSDSNGSIPLNVLEVTLGLFKLSEFRKNGSVSRELADYVIHPDYAHAKTGDSDLAILILRTSVKYSSFIKPICLWSGSTILQNVINRTGYVVGWGRDEYGVNTEEPRKATVSIINHAECHWNDPRFVYLTTNRTFCAGSLDNSIPCNGDSGSGLILFDAVTGRYQLRGIVSRTIQNQSEQTCDPTKFTVYADVAQYIPWIQEQISQEIGSNVRPTMPSQYDSNDNNNINNEYGIAQHVGSNVNLLVANGDKTLPGQWPWLVALFLVRTEHEFQCAGSILTNRHIITAAHCLKFNNNYSISPNVLLVALGRFKLDEFREHGTVNREVASYRIHPDYAHANTADSNLAILILKTSVEYSPFIKPICLWSGSTILQNVVNRTGYVVGWGRDEFGHCYTKEPRKATVSIRDQAECHWNHPRFVFLTTNRTFCAGSLDNSIPCNGDSGSGLVFFDATTSRYQLRGIVSRTVSVYNQSKQICDPTKFTVYADVAQYTPWIQEQISTT